MKLPFDPDAAPEDWRDLIEFDVEYESPTPQQCTYCLRQGPAAPREGITITKLHRARMPRGYIECRCPGHLK